jgi:hypothetical protein
VTPASSRRIELALAAALLCAPPASVARAGEPDEAPAQATAQATALGFALAPEHLSIAAALRAARSPDAPSADQLAARIAGCGPGALGAQLDLLVARRVPQCGPDDQPQILSVPQRVILLDGLARMGSARARAELETRLAAAPRDPALALAAVDVLGAVGSVDDLRRLAELAPRRGAEERALTREARSSLRAAGASILRRSDAAWRAWATGVCSVDPAAGRELLDAVGEVRDPRALGVLHQVARCRPELEDHAIALAAGCAPSTDAALRADFAAWALNALAGARRERARLLLRALGAHDDGEAVPALIGTLTHEDRALRQAARDALHAMTGLGLPADASAWGAWYELELRWNENERARCRELLASRQRETVAGVLREYAARRVHRSRLAGDVEPLLGAADPTVRRLACMTLRELRAPGSCQALAGALADPDPAVARTAWEALCAISGLELPQDAERVRDLLKI